jgi:hypothetical protein
MLPKRGLFPISELSSATYLETAIDDFQDNATLLQARDNLTSVHRYPHRSEGTAGSPACTDAMQRGRYRQACLFPEFLKIHHPDGLA